VRILFMGTPEYALFCLRALCEAGENIVGVVTQPDKPRGRGHHMQPPPVKVYAEEQGIAVYQPETLKDGAFLPTLEALSPELIVVVAYGKILPAYVLDYPQHGCINVHGSLLPAYRGAAPMQRVILEGGRETGVTIMQMDKGLDTGDMLLKKAFPIGENDNFETVHDNMGRVGAEALIEVLDMIKVGRLAPVKQNEADATYAAKIEKSDCHISFAATAQEVHDRIRALSPFPLAFTHTPDGKLLKIVESRVGESETDAKAGSVLSLDNGRMTVACGSGTVELLTVLPEGKGRMSAADYIRGRRLLVGDILGD